MALLKSYVTCQWCNGAGILNSRDGLGDPTVENPCSKCNGSAIIEVGFLDDSGAIAANNIILNGIVSDLATIVNKLNNLKDKCDNIKDKCDQIWDKVK